MIRATGGIFRQGFLAIVTLAAAASIAGRVALGADQPNAPAPPSPAAAAPSTPPKTPDKTAAPAPATAAAPTPKDQGGNAAASPPAKAESGATPPAAPGKPKLTQTINDMVRVLETVQALDQPDAQGKPLGRLRAGVKIKADGVVEGGKWVQVELPNQAVAFVPHEALALGGAPGSPAPTELAKITGPVSAVPNAATLVIDGRTIQLAGIDPGPAKVLGPFETWVRSHGPLNCEPVAQTGRYRCLTDTNIDVAEAAILNGAGRVGEGASVTYRETEKTAREDKRGLWGQN